MKKEFIQEQVLKKISAKLNNGTPKEELWALANDLIELCQRHGGDRVPDKDILNAIHDHPNLSKDLYELVRQGYEYAPDETMEAIRHGLNSKMHH